MESEQSSLQITAVACWHCDFSSGHRGMDRCSKCDGTGSMLLVKDKYFPNTEEGYKQALQYLEKTVISKDD